MAPEAIPCPSSATTRPGQAVGFVLRAPWVCDAGHHRWEPPTSGALLVVGLVVGAGPGGLLLFAGLLADHGLFQPKPRVQMIVLALSLGLFLLRVAGSCLRALLRRRR